MTEAPFRWLVPGLLVVALSVSTFHRARARRIAPIPRVREGWPALTARMAAGLLVLGTVVLYAVRPQLLAWSFVPVPRWVRWAGVGLAAGAVPLLAWVLRSLGANISETVFTKSTHQLVTVGPYARVRHPLYAGGVMLLAGLGLATRSAVLLTAAPAAAVLVLWLVVPAEERALEARFGDAYRAYRRRTGRLLPRWRQPRR